MISLLHTTVRPNAWKTAADNWFQNCDHSGNVEYVLVPEKKQFPSLSNLGVPFEHQVVEYNGNNQTPVGGYNFAAQISHGEVLVLVADDFYSAPHWDTNLLNLLNGKLDQEVAVWANTNMPSFDPYFISFPIITRPYYKRYGYLFCPEYTSCYADVEFYEVTELDKIEIIDARNVLMFQHLRGGIGGAFRDDEDYMKHGGPGDRSGDLYSKRKAAGFPREVLPQ